MRSHRFTWMTLCALALWGCGDSGAFNPEDVSDMQVHLDALRTEQSAHLSAIARAPELDTVDRAEDGHWRRLDVHFNAMNLIVVGMTSCDAPMMQSSGAVFAGSLQDLRSECDEHRSEVLASTSLDGARIEESAYQARISRKLADLEVLLGTMISDAARSACSH